MKILVTRPIKQATITAGKLKARGHQAIVEPLLTILPIDTKLPSDRFNAIVLTSTNAVERLDKTWPIQGRDKVPVLVTGEVTRMAARDAGFSITLSVNGSARDLVAAVPAWQKKHRHMHSWRILYPCAKTIARDINSELAVQNIECIFWPVYETIPKEFFSAEVSRQLALGQIDFILLYSAKTARAFSEMIEKLGVNTESIKTLVLSKEIRQSLPAPLQSKCFFPETPNEEALLELIVS